MAFDRRSSYSTEDTVAAVYAELGRAYVEPLGPGPHDLAILDGDRAEILTAWAGALIPGNDRWPSASEVGVVPYVDRTLQIAVGARGPLLRILDDSQAHALEDFGQPFAVLSLEHRTQILRTVEAHEPLVFTVLKELTYEVYYRDRAVVTALRHATGFRSDIPVNGIELEHFDDDLFLLADIAERPSLVRAVEP